MIVTSAMEVLTQDGIHGKIGQVGIGFGTGRHTANVHNHTKKVTEGQRSQNSQVTPERQRGSQQPPKLTPGRKNSNINRTIENKSVTHDVAVGIA